MLFESEKMEQLIELARSAGKAVLELYNSSSDVESKLKTDESPVTAADLASEKILLEGLKRFGYPILSEETPDDDSRLKHERLWIIDPLDGTKDFLKNTGEFSILIGLAERGRPALGVVYQPIGDIVYYAQRGKGAYLKKGSESSKMLHVSQQVNPEKMRMLMSRNHLREPEVFVAKQFSITHHIPAGSAGLKIARVASGEVDLTINSSDRTGEWDTCAAQCILEEAGGAMTSLDGEPIEYNKQVPKNLRGYVASNGLVHDHVIAALREYI